jgi:hypothetical protein
MPRDNPKWPILPSGWQDRQAKEKAKNNGAQTPRDPSAQNKRYRGENASRGKAGGATRRPDDLQSLDIDEDHEGEAA